MTKCENSLAIGATVSFFDYSLNSLSHAVDFTHMHVTVMLLNSLRSHRPKNIGKFDSFPAELRSNDEADALLEAIVVVV